MGGGSEIKRAWSCSQIHPIHCWLYSHHQTRFRCDIFLECIAFQLLFLVVYDFYLKKETFFQWNRLYLLGTFALSLILPWVKIEAFKQQVPQTFAPYPEYLWKLQNEAVVAQVQETSGWNITWQEGILYGGMLVALLLFGLKIRQLYLLRRSGEKVTYPSFTQIIITNSNIAFSFFASCGTSY